MKRVMRNLLPRDTRAVEYISGMSLIWVSISFMFGDITPQMARLYPADYWGVAALVFGLLQLISMMWYPRYRPMRSVVVWATGSFWVWIGTQYSLNLAILQIPILFLGLSCLYAFIINIIILSEIWKQ